LQKKPAVKKKQKERNPGEITSKEIPKRLQPIVGKSQPYSMDIPLFAPFILFHGSGCSISHSLGIQW
jgi:hypothetical protein